MLCASASPLPRACAHAQAGATFFLKTNAHRGEGLRQLAAEEAYEEAAASTCAGALPAARTPSGAFAHTARLGPLTMLRPAPLPPARREGARKWSLAQVAVAPQLRIGGKGLNLRAHMLITSHSPLRAYLVRALC